MPEVLWTTKQAAAYLGLTENAFRVRRHRGEAPPGERLGGRTWRYRKTAIDQWLRDNTEAHRASA